MSPDLRGQVLKQLRRPGRKADMLIERHLGFPARADGCQPYTGDVEAAMRLLPGGVLFVCGRFEESTLYWCDVGFRPRVQAWGESLAAAIAGAIFAYRTHPEVRECRGSEKSASGKGSG